MSNESDLCTFNGIDGVTGAYLTPPMPPERLSAWAQGPVSDSRHLEELRWAYKRATQASFGPKEGVNPKELGESGWGVVFAHDADPAVREALRPLLDHRQRQAAARHERYYREFVDENAYRPQESKQDFLARHGAGPGPADPRTVPYYLLIVGDPESIPYAFQYQLDVQYAVGRIHFDSTDEYAAYAGNVVRAETEDLSLPRRAVFLGTANQDDRATALSTAQLVSPLVERFRADQPGWDVHTLTGEAATKDGLTAAMCGTERAALLFTATHGVGFPNGHPRQRRHQGALVCQDWPGPNSGVVPSEEHLFSGDDVSEEADFAGLIAFHFACFGAGTPRWDEFAAVSAPERQQMTARAFVAALPKRMLGHSRSGSLATIAHVERAWGYSFTWPGAGEQTAVFESCLARLVSGHPIGSAFEYFNERYAELSSDLSTELENLRFGKIRDDNKLVAMWTANNDARNFTILGDPAIRLAVSDGDAGQEAPLGRVAVPLTSQKPAKPDDGTPADVLTMTASDRAAGIGAPSGMTSPEAPIEPGDTEYGLFGDAKEVRDRLGGSLQNLAESLGRVLARTSENLASLEVHTYVSDDVSGAHYDSATKRFSGGVELRAVTRLGLDGDLSLIVPRQADDLDDKLWQMHVSMVEQARTTREELVKTVASALSGLVQGLKLL